MADDMIEDIVQALNRTPVDDNTRDGGYWPKMVQFIEHIAEQEEFYKVILATKRTPIFMERLLNLVTEMMEENLEKKEAAPSFQKQGFQRTLPCGMYPQHCLEPLSGG